MKQIYKFIFLMVLGVYASSSVLAAEVIEDVSQETTIPVSAVSEAPSAAEVVDVFYRSEVVGVEEVTSEVAGQELRAQIVTVKFLEGDKKGEIVSINRGGTTDLMEAEIYKEGDEIIVTGFLAGSEWKYFVYDRYRVPGLMVVVTVFLVLSLIFARLRGLGSILGLCISVGILMWYIVPALIAGGNPVIVTLSGTLAIVALTLFVSHGFRLRTAIALVTTMMTIAVAYGLSVFFVSVSQMFGSGTEESFYLQFAVSEASGVNIDLRGLLLGGIIIGMLGVLDDVTMGQAAALDEVKRANPRLTFWDLYRAGMSVGRDHIASLVNTLALAYVGSSLPLFLLLSMNERGTPFWVMVNSEFISQEIVRTIAGSSAIILAVPITTVVAAYVYSRIKLPPRREENDPVFHVHGHHH